MYPRALRTLTLSALTAALASLALPATGDAKVSCEGGVELSSLELVGLPADPEARRGYAVTVDLPHKHAVNPRALLIGVRCGRDGHGLVDAYLRGADSVQFRGTPAGPAASSFQVRFPSAGRWRLASMDVSGSFRDHGFFTVRSPASTPIDAGGVASAPLVIAAAMIVSAGLALGLLRRARRRDGTY